MEILIGAGIGVLGQVLKRFVAKWGDAAIHSAVFAVALVVTAVWQYAQYDPTFMAYLQKAGVMMLAAIGSYEVILKRLGVAKKWELR